MKRIGPTRRVLLRVAFYGAAVFLGLPAAFCHVLVGAHHRPAAPPPPGYEEVRLVSEGLRLRAWLRRGTGERPAVVVGHGLGDSLESWTEVASVLGRRGHAVLLMDFRAHGGSEGRATTLGGREREDVRAAMRYLREAGLAGRGIVLVGYSMGAVAALRAAVGEDDVRAVIAEAPYDNYRESVAHHAYLLYRLPRWVPLIPLTIAFAEAWAGFDADEVDAVAAARRLRTPFLAIVDGADPRMPEAVVRRVFDAHPGPKSLWVASGAEHVGAILHPEYWPRVLAFLEAHGL